MRWLRSVGYFGTTLSRRAARTLQELGVELHMGSVVIAVDGDGVVVRDHDGNQTRYDAHTVLWTARARPAYRRSAGQSDRHRMRPGDAPHI